MKIFNFFLCIALVTFSSISLEAKVVDVVDPVPDPINFQTRGCGYTSPLRVAGMIGNPPFGWVERHDERSSQDLESYGLGRLVLDKLAKKLKFSYTSTGFLSYSRAINALKRGEIDLLLTAYFRPQDLGRGTSIVSPGYFKNVFTVYFKKGAELPITSFADLDGLKGVIRREENIYPLIHQKLPQGTNLIHVSTAKKAFEMLMNGEADYMITSPYAAEAELRRYKLNNDIVPASVALSSSNLFFVFTTNRNCRQLKEKFSEALQGEDFSAPVIEEMVKKLIDDWGERFRDAPGLIEEEVEEKEGPKEEIPPQKLTED